MTRLRAYQILGLYDGAPEAAVHAAWRAQAKAMHPDMPGGSLEAFIRAKKAYDLLKPALERPQRIRVQAGRRQVA